MVQSLWLLHVPMVTQTNPADWLDVLAPNSLSIPSDLVGGKDEIVRSEFCNSLVEWWRAQLMCGMGGLDQISRCLWGVTTLHPLPRTILNATVWMNIHRVLLKIHHWSAEAHKNHMWSQYWIEIHHVHAVAFEWTGCWGLWTTYWEPMEPERSGSNAPNAEERMGKSIALPATIQSTKTKLRKQHLANGPVRYAKRSSTQRLALGNIRGWHTQ